MQQQTDSWLPQIGAKLREKVYKTAAEQQAVLKDDLTKCSTDKEAVMKWNLMFFFTPKPKPK